LVIKKEEKKEEKKRKRKTRDTIASLVTIACVEVYSGKVKLY